MKNFDRIELIRTFVRIVESGSLSAAAAQLELTQPTISRRLQALEALLSSKLLLRTTHGMKLTDDGERCYEHSKHVLGNWEALCDELSGSDNQATGLLRVRVPHAFGQDQMIASLTKLLKRYPKVSVEWLLYDQTPDFIAENIDCAVHVGPITDPGNIARLLAEIPRILVAAPRLLSQYQPVIDTSTLQDLPWIALSTFYKREVCLYHKKSGQQHQITINPRLFSDSLYAVKNAALSGLGAAIVSRWVVEEEIRTGQLVHLLPEWQSQSLPVYLIYPYANYYPSRLRIFLDLMQKTMPQIVGS